MTVALHKIKLKNLSNRKNYYLKLKCLNCTDYSKI